MANFIAIIDANRERRSKFIAAIKDNLPPVAGLKVVCCDKGDFSAAWAFAQNAPITQAGSELSSAILFGRPVSERPQENIDAQILMTLWNDPQKRKQAFYNGFYAGIVYDTHLGLTIGADILGIYPVYYWQYNNVLLAGSSPELFSYHPYFSRKLNAQGLISILLMSHIFDGQTLLKGVKRLNAGCLLRFEPGKNAYEENQYKIQLSTRYYDLPFSAHCEVLGEALEDTIGRHTAAKLNYSLLLSGGLDSRMLAGFLIEKNRQCRAITMGIDSDVEMQTAKNVARYLGLPQCKMEVKYEQYINCAKNEAKWEHISNGFNDIFDWGYCTSLSDGDDALIMGHSIDAVIGTRYMTWAYSPVHRTMSFDTFFKNANRWAIRADILKKLLNKDKNLVDETIKNIEDKYNSFSKIESQKVWCFNLYNRQRFHVGGCAFAISFGVWPVMPAIDKTLLECAAAVPAASIADRRAQIELFCSRFPALAQLPIDRNSYDTTPLRPRVRYLVQQEVLNLLRRIPGSSTNGKAEHRYYYRIYDFDNKGWKAVRQEAESYRNKLYEIFNKEMLNTILPRPEENLNAKEKIEDTSGLKLLTGLMLWGKANL